LWLFGSAAALAAMGVAASLYIGRSTHVRAEKVAHDDGRTAPKETPDENSAGTDHPAVCGLATKEEVAKATHTPIVSATSNEDGELCTYTPADESLNTATVQVAWEGGEFALRAGSALMQGAAGSAEFRQPEQGVGDEAFVLGVGQDSQKQIDRSLPPELKALATLTIGPLMFRKGDIMVTVTANFIDNKFEAEKEIATKVASRL
jgi:hypothetical protein